jgi:hypothetical protein
LHSAAPPANSLKDATQHAGTHRNYTCTSCSSNLLLLLIFEPQTVDLASGHMLTTVSLLPLLPVMSTESGHSSNIRISILFHRFLYAMLINLMSIYFNLSSMYPDNMKYKYAGMLHSYSFTYY